MRLRDRLGAIELVGLADVAPLGQFPRWRCRGSYAETRILRRRASRRRRRGCRRSRCQQCAFGAGARGGRLPVCGGYVYREGRHAELLSVAGRLTISRSRSGGPDRPHADSLMRNRTRRRRPRRGGCLRQRDGVTSAPPLSMLPVMSLRWKRSSGASDGKLRTPRPPRVYCCSPPPR